MSIRNRVRRLVDSSLFNICIALLILLSIVFIVWEYSLPPGHTDQWVIATNAIFTWIFVTELLLRFYAAPNKRIFFRNYWLDILAVLPMLRIFRTLRLLRLLRLLRVVRASVILLRQSGWLSTRIQRHFGNFGLLFIVTVMLIVCGTLGLLLVEPASESGRPVLEEFGIRVWETTFLFISGEIMDEAPPTAAGKAVAALIAIAGLVLFAVMVGTISGTMTTFLRTQMEARDILIDDLQGHLIICGWDRMGAVILQEVESVPEFWHRGVVVVSERDIDIVKEAHIKDPRHFFHLKSDFTKMEVLERAGAKGANAAIVLADKGNNLRDQDRDARTVLAALTLEKINPQIFTVAELLDEQNATHLKIAGVEEIVSRTKLTAGLFAANVLNKGVSSFVRGILTNQGGMAVRKIACPEEFVGHPFIEAFEYFKREKNATLLAVEREEKTGESEGINTKEHFNPEPDYLLCKGDKLLLLEQRGGSGTNLKST